MSGFLSKALNSKVGGRLMSLTPQGKALQTAAKGAKYGSYMMFFCCFISFVIWIGTLIGTYTTKDPKQKKTLQGTWIAFLVLTIISLIVAMYLRTKSSPSKILGGASEAAASALK